MTRDRVVKYRLVGSKYKKRIKKDMVILTCPYCETVTETKRGALVGLGKCCTGCKAKFLGDGYVYERK